MAGNYKKKEERIIFRVMGNEFTFTHMKFEVMMDFGECFLNNGQIERETDHV